MLKENLILLGPSGAGKTSCSKLLAERLGYLLLDTDALIEEATAMSPAQIFATMGEAAFRTMENELLRQIAMEKTGSPFVMATGGGLPASENNLEILQNLGITFYLQADSATLAKRVSGDVERPMLKNGAGELTERIDTLLAKRAAFYGQSRHTVDTRGMTVEETVETILNYLQ